MPCEHCPHCKRLASQRSGLHAEHLNPPVPGKGFQSRDGLDPYQRVRALILARGLTNRAFAVGAGVNETSVSKAFHRCSGFKAHWPAIGRFFAVSLDWLLTPAPSLDTERNSDRPSVEAMASPASGAASDADQPSAG